MRVTACDELGNPTGKHIEFNAVSAVLRIYTAGKLSPYTLLPSFDSVPPGTTYEQHYLNKQVEQWAQTSYAYIMTIQVFDGFGIAISEISNNFTTGTSPESLNESLRVRWMDVTTLQQQNLNLQPVLLVDPVYQSLKSEATSFAPLAGITYTFSIFGFDAVTVNTQIPRRPQWPETTIYDIVYVPRDNVRRINVQVKYLDSVANKEVTTTLVRLIQTNSN